MFSGIRRQANFAEAMVNCERAIEIKPDDAEVYYNMGTLLGNQGRYNEAINYYKQAIQLRSDHARAHLNLSLALLLLQRFTEGWKEYSWRRETDSNRSYYQRCSEKAIWDGCSFAGKRLLVACEQGLGDSIHFARYLPLVKARGGTVIFETWKPLLALFQQLADVDKLAEVSSYDLSDSSFDYYVPLLDLPMIFDTDLDTIPANVPYLYADQVKARCWKDKFDTEKFNVGIVWAGSSEHGNNHNRSCLLEHFAPLTKIKGVRLYSLQKDPAAGQLANLPEVTGLADEFEDFTDTAAVIDNLDLVISVDTAVAHLAGAMGIPVWTLIPFAPDWRWMLDRDDSPWYPTMKLFRQEKYGDWEGVFAHVAEQLEILV